MPRTYSNASLVSLPHLSAPNAVTLGTRLLSAAAAHRARMSPTLTKSVDRLAAALDALRVSRTLRREAEAVDPGAAFAADVRVDAACAGFHGFLHGWARLPAPGPGADQAEQARRLLDVLFPLGLAFTQAPFVTEWAEVQTLLDRADQPKSAKLVRALGAELFVEAIHQAFEAYGEALHVTRRRAKIKATARLREPLDALLSALRSYVLRVTAHADEADDRGEPEALALADALLEPLVAWRAGSGRKVKGEPADEPAPEPKGEPAPPRV